MTLPLLLLPAVLTTRSVTAAQAAGHGNISGRMSDSTSRQRRITSRENAWVAACAAMTGEGCFACPLMTEVGVGRAWKGDV